MQHLRFSYGPLYAAPGQNLILVGPAAILGPPIDGYITSIRPNIVDENGVTPPVEQVHMHHAVFLNLSRRDVTRPDLPGERMFAFAEEKTTFRLPAGYGYPYKATDQFAINYMLHNETPQGHAIYITYELDFVPAIAPQAASMQAARPLWLDVQNGSAYPVFDVHRGSGGASGRTTYPLDGPSPYGKGPRLNEWTVDRDGVLLATAGHVHPGGLQTDLDLLRDGRRAHLFTSVAEYFDPQGPVSWDMAMTITPEDWHVQVRKGDVLRVSATYDTTRASWFESMGIMLVYMADGQGGRDPFGTAVPTTGGVTHGELKEATNFGGAPTGRPDPATLPDGQTVINGVAIVNFAYLPGDQAGSPAPPAIAPGGSLTFGNFDSPSSILHTITSCRSPCNGTTGVSYPLADGTFDSGDLGYGPTGFTAAKNDGQWSTPKSLPPGTYTYFCRIHPFMRGSFRIKGATATAPGAAAQRLSIRSRRIRADRRGFARVALACDRGGARCRGRLALAWNAGPRRGKATGDVVVGTARYALGAGRHGSARVRLTRAGRRVLARRHRLLVRVIATGGAATALLERR